MTDRAHKINRLTAKMPDLGVTRTEDGRWQMGDTVYLPARMQEILQAEAARRWEHR